MQKSFRFVLIIATLIMACNQEEAVKRQGYEWPSNVKAPIAEKKAKDLGMHGDSRIDEYYWLNDYFKKGPDSNRVVEYLKAENAYLDTIMSGTKDFQKKLFSEMKGRIKEKDESVPVFRNGYYYYNRYEEGKQYYIYCRKKGNLDAAEQVLLNINELAIGHDYFSAVGFSISPDNKLLAYGIDTVSRREYTIHVKNLETGEVLKDAIYPTTGGSEWANDNKTLFYTEKNPVTLLSEKIKRHTLGADASTDAVVYHEKDKTNYIGVGKTKSDKYIVIYTGGTLSSENLILDADQPNGNFTSFQPRMKEVLYNIDHLGDKFLIVTNKEAKNFKVMETPVGKTAVENWKDLIPHRTDVLVEGIEVFKDFLVITERKEGLLKLRIQDKKKGEEHYLDFGEPAYTAYTGANPEFNTTTLRYQYTSLTTPNSTFDYNMDSKEKKLMKQQEVVGGYDPKQYVTERLFVDAKDGVRVPVSLVYKKGFNKDGNAPLLLYGYGSYGNSMDATFSSSRLSLVDRGFVYAIAHVRGGQELGRLWYEDGKMLKKKNTFTDFIDVAEALINQKYTSKEHLYAMGGSAGGLLVGAVTVMRPDLWHGVVAQVPFVDVVTTMMDPTIPLTTNEYDEWGNPENKDAYFYMKSYSPYDNVQKTEYPNLLVTTGLHDSQVQYFEPAKWVAKMREMKTGDNLLLLYTNMEVGHGGASGRFDYLKDVALQYAFLLALEGITE